MRSATGLYLAYLDLDELPALLKGGYGLSRAAFAPASFRRTDHLGDPQVPLADAVRDLVQERTGWRPAGPIRLLTLLRNWGYYFNPLRLYYCFDPAAREVEAVVAEVTNTPWRERHWYVLWQGNRIGEPSQLRFRHPKDFHVSPFLDMDLVYEWHLHVPAEQLRVAHRQLPGPGAGVRRQPDAAAPRVDSREHAPRAGSLSLDDRPGDPGHPLAGVSAVAEEMPVLCPSEASSGVGGPATMTDAAPHAAARSPSNASLHRPRGRAASCGAAWRRLDDGQLVLDDGGERREFGRSGEGSLAARIEVRDPRFYRQLVFGGSLGAAEAYHPGLLGLRRPGQPGPHLLPQRCGRERPGTRAGPRCSARWPGSPTPGGGTRRPGAAATSPPITTWATSSSRCSSTRPWPTPARSSRTPQARSTKRRWPSSTGSAASSA